MSWRLSADQQQQILSLDSIGAAALRRAIGWQNGTGMTALCRFVWTDEAAFNTVCDALKKEALRAWLVRVSGLFSSAEWSMMKQTVWMCDFKDCDLYAPTRTYEQLEKLRNFVVERMEQAPKNKEETAVSAPTPVRIPIPEWTRKTILKFVFDPAVEREYIVLKNYYMQYLCPPELRKVGWADWRVHFIDEKDVADFQTRVDQVERYWLIARIRSAIDAYPLSKYAEFNSMVEKHFGVKARVHEWYTYTHCPLEDMRFYLEMLGEHNLNKVKLMIEPTILNCVALFDCTATETKSKAAEPEVPAPAPLTLAERKIRFLRQLHGKDCFWSSLASYMDQTESNCNLEGIARKVSLTDDEARLSEWEAIINKTDPEHIFWKLFDHEIGEVERPILKGLADLPANDSRSVQQRILFWWNTYKQPKRELICAYLDTLPLKEQKK